MENSQLTIAIAIIAASFVPMAMLGFFFKRRKKMLRTIEIDRQMNGAAPPPTLMVDEPTSPLSPAAGTEVESIKVVEQVPPNSNSRAGSLRSSNPSIGTPSPSVGSELDGGANGVAPSDGGPPSDGGAPSDGSPSPSVAAPLRMNFEPESPPPGLQDTKRDSSWSIPDSHLEETEPDNGDCSQRDSAHLSSLQVVVQGPHIPGPLEMRRLGNGASQKHCYSEPLGDDFMVRGPTYTSDKIKQKAGESAFELLTVELFETPPHEMVSHRLSQKDSPLESLRALGRNKLIFAVNMQVPGRPGYSIIFYYGLRENCTPETDPAFHGLLTKFITTDDSFRDTRFKLVPNISEGNWVVKKAVGSRPAILGTKLKQTYFSGEGYFELDVNVMVNATAAKLTNMCKSYAASLVIDMAFVLEGQSEQELPERVLGAVRLHYPDMVGKDVIPKLPEELSSPQKAKSNSITNLGVGIKDIGRSMGL